jgi:DNA repair exonuclease SbcCD ATPase subunit
LIDSVNDLKQAEKITTEFTEFKEVLSKEGADLLLKLEKDPPQNSTFDEYECYIQTMQKVKKFIERLKDKDEGLSGQDLNEIDKYFTKIGKKNESENSDLLKTYREKASELINTLEEAEEQGETLDTLHNDLGRIVKESNELLYATKVIELSSEETEKLESLHKLAVDELKKWEEKIKAFDPIDNAIKKMQKIAKNMLQEEKSFNFNSLDNKRTENFNNKAPRWRIVIPGLNLLANCDYERCDAYKDAIWIKIGINNEELKIFNIAKLSKLATCPECNVKAVNVNNLGFYGCYYTITGWKEGAKKGIDIPKTQAESSRFTTFLNGDNTEWAFLEVVTSLN